MQSKERIIEDLEKIKERTCEEICKYYAQAEERGKMIHGDDMILRSEIINVISDELHRHCDECPLSRL